MGLAGDNVVCVVGGPAPNTDYVSLFTFLDLIPEIENLIYNVS